MLSMYSPVTGPMITYGGAAPFPHGESSGQVVFPKVKHPHGNWQRGSSDSIGSGDDGFVVDSDDSDGDEPFNSSKKFCWQLR